jgi:hypothetical protein
MKMECLDCIPKSSIGSGLPEKNTFAKRSQQLKVLSFCAGKNTDRSSFFPTSRVGDSAGFYAGSVVVKESYPGRGLF